MSNTNKVTYELEHFYPKFDRQKFFDLFIDYEAWTKSGLLPEVQILNLGKDYPLGLGGVRLVVSGDMKIEEEVVGFQYPEYFSYSSRNGDMPVDNFLGKILLEEKDGGVLIKYEGSFNPKDSGFDPSMIEMFKAAQKSVFENLGKVYTEYHK